MTYEVDDALGCCLYRGDDLELACDIYEHERDAHLEIRPVPAPPVRQTGAGWDRPPQTRTATT
ncbi:MAG: hypothetical protein QOC93_640 [Actinomycetota bacterium]|jgi:hypothetical protein|nr:hypothetical protein [Cryptosporangiaceae bacterium]MDQ1675496.1 hypothetical protein [Actinomycetota bacterium]